MSNQEGAYQIIDCLCRMLTTAVIIIKKQAEILAMHGITTESGELENDRQALLKQMEGGMGT